MAMVTVVARVGVVAGDTSEIFIFGSKNGRKKKTALRLGILRDLIYGSVAISAGRFEDKSAPDYFRERRLGQSDKPTAPVVGWGQCGLGHSVPVSTPVSSLVPKQSHSHHTPRGRGVQANDWKNMGFVPPFSTRYFLAMPIPD